MPELPEMQALSERLDVMLSGSVLAEVAVLHFSAVKTFAPEPAALVGRALKGVGRRGKYLVFDFGGPRLLVHLSQGGRIDLEKPPKKTRPKGGVARLGFDNGVALLIKEFGTQRKAGFWVVAQGDDGPVGRLGPEPYSPEFEHRLLHAQDKRRLHTLLRDQKTVAGIGRGYADDILNEARLSPYATLHGMPVAERRQLLEVIRRVLEYALQVERKRRGGLPTKLGDHFLVHGRAGQPCPRCGEVLHRISYEDYEVAYCPRCQTGGKVLADRRLSRLIR